MSRFVAWLLLYEFLLCFFFFSGPVSAQAPEQAPGEAREERAALDQQAELKLQEGERTQAIELYRAFLAEQPQEFHAWMRLGELLRLEKSYDDALVAYQQARRLAPDNLEVVLEMARVLAAKGELKESLALYESVLEREPGNRQARIGLARTLSWSDRFRESNEMYRQILRVDSGDLEAGLGLAQVQAWDKSYDEALETYRLLLEKEPDNLEARLGEARILAWRGDLADSVRAYEDILKSSPDSAEVHAGLGKVKSWQAMDRDAFFHLRRALELQADHEEAGESLKQLEFQHKPELASVLTIARDSDANDLQILGGDLSFDVDPQTRLRLSYRNFNTFNDGQGRAGQADLFLANAVTRLSPEVAVRGSLGVAALDPTGGRFGQRAVGGIGLQLTPTNNQNITLGYSRDVLLETAQLIDNKISIDSLDFGYRLRMGEDNELSLGYGRATFSDDNNRNLYTATFSRSLRRDWPQLRVGYNQRLTHFERQTFNGYFSPRSLQVGEAFLDFEQRDPKKPWIYALGAAGGYQKISGEDSQFVYRITAGLGYRIDDGAVIELAGLTSTSALSSVQGFRYNAGTLRMNFRF